jgi:nitrous oxidase accessory protein NosD
VNGSYCNIEENNLLGDVGVNGSYSNIVENIFSGTLWAFGSHLNISANNKTSSNKVGTQDSGIRLDGSFCLVYGNNLTAEDLASGIGVSGEGNIVASNFVDHAYVGIAISGSGNIICANRITNSWSGSFFPSSSNPSVGIGLVASGNSTFYANYVANNEWGAKINQFQTNLSSTLYHNNFISNTHQIATDNSYDIYGKDSFDNGKEGNFWSDYNGTDADGNGIGDTPYVIDSNRKDNYPLMTPFNISSVTIQLPTWASPPAKTTPEPQDSEAEPLSFSTTWIIAAVAVVAAAIIGGAWTMSRNAKSKLKTKNRNLMIQPL